MPSGNLSRNEAASSLRYRFDRSDTLQRSAETQVLYRSAQSQTDFKLDIYAAGSPRMTPDERREHEERMRAMDDAALRCLVVLQGSDYRPEVVSIARDELARRRIPVLSPEDYWKQYPQEWVAAVGFCYRCWTQTTDESPGHTATVNFIGTRLLGSDEQCPACGSVVQTKWFCVIVPIVPLGRYRVIHAARGEYIGRRLEGSRR